MDLITPSDTPVVISAKGLKEHLVAAFSGHVFSPRQLLALRLPEEVAEGGGVGLKLHLRSFVPYSKADLVGHAAAEGGPGGAEAEAVVAPGAFATLSAHTDITFLKTKGSAVQFKGVVGHSKPVFDKGFDFASMDIGGLDAEFATIFRKAFVSRMLPPSLVADMGLPHVKGILLFGPPGCGKTLIARELAKALKAKPPKIVNGPEILDKYVGAAEERIRDLFKDAEEEQAEKGDASDLHIIIFDEIDSICRKRGTITNGTGVHDSIVNQLLSKIDGVNSLNNILLIGMTNRKDMLDPALMRPGRFEVHMEISLPDAAGRVQILNIHTKQLASKGFLADDFDVKGLSTITENFTGAELARVVRDARSYALSEVFDADKGTLDYQRLRVTQEHFERAISTAEPAFGKKDDELVVYTPHGIIHYSEEFERVTHALQRSMRQVAAPSSRTALLSVCLTGPAGSGKSALTAHLAQLSSFAYVKRLGADTLVGQDGHGKVAALTETFSDAYKSPLSFIILDDIERMIEWVDIGPHFNNPVLQTLMVLLKRPPPKLGHKLVVVCTTTAGVLSRLGMEGSFSLAFDMPAPESQAEFKAILSAFNMPPADQDRAAGLLHSKGDTLSLKKLLLVLDIASQYAAEDGEGKGGEGEGTPVAAAGAGAGDGATSPPVSIEAFESALLEVVGFL